MRAVARREWIVGCTVALLECSKRIEGPEEPVWGKQACAQCAMVLSDKRYAAQLVDMDGNRSHFDDLGCLVSFIAAHHVGERYIWVRDEASDRWLKAETARYHSGAKTPMDYGFAAGTMGDLAFEDVRRAVMSRPRGGS